MAHAETALTLDTTDTNDYGYAFNGKYTNVQTAEFSFLGGEYNLVLTLDAFDIDLDNEIEVLVNGTPLTNLSTTNNISIAQDTLVIPAAVQVKGKNILQFKQNTIGWIWGISNLHLSIESAQQLEIGSVDSGSYGFGFKNLYTHQKSAQFRFEGTDSDLYLSLATHDIDTENEVNVFVNGQSIGHLSVTENNTDGRATFRIPAAMQVADSNTLEFTQKTPGLIWGIESLELNKQAVTTNQVVTTELSATNLATNKYSFNATVFSALLSDIFKSKYALLLVVLSYVIYVFVSERVNPFVITTPPLKKRRLRLGRAAALVSLASGTIAIFCLISYQLDIKKAAAIYVALAVLLFIPSLIKYQRSSIWQ